MQSSQDSASLIHSLKRALKQAGWTQARIAAALGIGTATAKRWLSGRSVTLHQLDLLANLAGSSLLEIAREADRPDPDLPQELTLAQERALSSDVLLSFIFMTILAGAEPHEMEADFEIPARQIDDALARLERLALIDRRPGRRVRPRIDRSIIWRKSPMRTLFETNMKAQFLSMDFAADDAIYASDIIKLSAKGAATLTEMIEQHRQAVQALAAKDREQTLLQRKWFATLTVARPLDASQLQRD